MFHTYVVAVQSSDNSSDWADDVIVVAEGSGEAQELARQHILDEFAERTEVTGTQAHLIDQRPTRVMGRLIRPYGYPEAPSQHGTAYWAEACTCGHERVQHQSGDGAFTGFCSGTLGQLGGEYLYEGADPNEQCVCEAFVEDAVGV